MNFGDALKELKAGKSISRKDWKGGKRAYLDAGRIYFLTDEGSEGVYIASSKDLLAEDWACSGSTEELIAAGDIRLIGD